MTEDANNEVVESSSILTESERVSFYMEMWKQSVETQQHFNTIEWQIRGLALTVATFALGASGLVAKDGISIGKISFGAVVSVAGLVLWYAFYFVDRYWYHPLLKATVDHGSLIEDEIKRNLPQGGMTRKITAGSAYKPNRLVRFLSRTPKGGEMHSDDKLAWFYKIGAAALLVTAVGLQAAALLSPVAPSPQQVVVSVTQAASSGPTHR